MFSYPVHRQICPEMASRIVASSGSGSWSSSHRAVIIMPGVQNPHCSPWHAREALLDRVELGRRGPGPRPCAPGARRPSRPAPCRTSPGARPARPRRRRSSRCRSPSGSRSAAARRGGSGPAAAAASTSLVYAVPLTVTVICMSAGLPCARAAARGAAPARSARRPGAACSPPGRAGRRTGRQCSAAISPARRNVSGSGGAPRRNSSASAAAKFRAPTAVSPIPASPITLAVQPQRRAGRAHRPVARPAARPSRTRCRRRAGPGSGSR